MIKGNRWDTDTIIETHAAKSSGENIYQHSCFSSLVYALLVRI